MSDKVVKLTVDVGAKIDSLQSSLATMQKAFNNLKAPDNLTQDMVKAFKDVESRIENVKNNLKNNELDLVDEKEVQKDLLAIEKDFNRLTEKAENNSKKFTLVNVSKEGEALKKVIGEYNNKINEGTQNLKKQGDVIAATEKKIQEAKNKLDTASQVKGNADAELNNLKAQKEELEKLVELKRKSQEGNGRSDAQNEAALHRTKIYQQLQSVTEQFNNAEARATEATKRYEQQAKNTNTIISEESINLQKAKDKYDELNNALSNLKTDQLEAAKNALIEMSNNGLKLGFDPSQIQSIEELENKLKEIDQNDMAQVTNGLRAIISAGREGANAAKDQRKEIQGLTEAQKQANQEMEQFKSRITYFFGAANAVNLLRRAVRSAFETIKDLDKVMTETAVVTSFDVGDMWSQLPEYTKRANELGVSIHGAYEAATLYYQQGLKTNEVMAVSNETLKMARIAGLNAADATDRMTNALRGFNMEITEANAQNINDVYSNLAAKTASNVDEISTAMTKVASLANNANMSFENTAAFLSQIIETTRESAETAGTALKTVIARFSEVKSLYSEGQLLGDVEGEEIDVNKVSKALRTAGINLNEYLTGAKGLDEIFMELSAKWDSLDQVQQRYIATMAAGSRQQSRFIALMQDNARMTELVGEANNAAGASQKQFEKTLDSIETKLNQLQNAWNTFLMGLANDSVVKTVIDWLTKIIDLFNKITSGLPGVLGSFVKLGATIAIFKVGRTLINKAFSSMSGTITGQATKSGMQAGLSWKRGFQNKIKANGGLFTKQVLVPPTKKQWDDFNDSIKGSGLDSDQIKQVQITFSTQGYEAAKAQVEQMGGHLESINGEAKKFNATQTQTAVDLGKLGGAFMAVGGAISMLGQLFNDGSERGEKISKVFSTLGSVVMGVGTAIMVVGKIVPLFGVTVSRTMWATGAATAQAGTMAQLGWGWISLIMIAITALLVGVIALFNAIAANSPEAKLKKAEEAAENAAKAAEHAKEAYTDLSNAFDSLKDKYKNLEELTRGTDEWRKAMHEVNGEVLDLITKYPELSGLVNNEGGVLKLDIDSPEAQAILQKYEENSIKASSASIAAKGKVSAAQLQVSAKEITSANRQYANILEKEIASDAISTEKEIEGRAKQIGQLYNLSNEEVKALQDYGKAYKKYSTEQDAYYTALAANAAQLTGLEGELAEYAQSYLSANRYKTFEAKAASEISVNGKSPDAQREEYAKLMGYESYSEFKKGNNDKDATNEEIEAALRSAKASNLAADSALEFAKNLERADPLLQKIYKGKVDLTIKDLNKMLGTNLDVQGMSELSLSDLKSGSYLKAYVDEQFKDLYGISEITDSMRESIDYQELLNKIAVVEYEILQGTADAQSILNTSFSKEHNARFEAIAPEAAEDFNRRLRNITIAQGEEVGKSISEYMGDIISRMESLGEDPTQFVEALNSIDWNVQDIENLEQTLRDLGINIDYNSDSFEGLQNRLLEVAKTSNEIDMTKTIEALKNLNSIKAKFVKGEGTRIFSEEEYQKMVDAGVDSEVLKDFEQDLEGNFVYLGEKLDRLSNAIKDAYNLNSKRERIESAMSAQNTLNRNYSATYDPSSKLSSRDKTKMLNQYNRAEQYGKNKYYEYAITDWIEEKIGVSDSNSYGYLDSILEQYFGGREFKDVSVDEWYALIPKMASEHPKDSDTWNALSSYLTQAEKDYKNDIGMGYYFTLQQIDLNDITDLKTIKESGAKKEALSYYLQPLADSGFDFSLISDSGLWGPETLKNIEKLTDDELNQMINELIAFYQKNFSKDLEAANFSTLLSTALTAGVDPTVVGRYIDMYNEGDSAQQKFVKGQLSIITAINKEANALGISTEELKIYAEALQATNTEDTEGNLYRQALAALQLNQGLEKIIDSYKDWTKLIGPNGKFKTPVTPEEAKILNDFKENLKEAFGISDEVADAFMNDANNLALIKRAAEGDVDAINKLQDKIKILNAQNFLIDIGTEIDTEKFDDEYNALAQWIVNNNLPDIVAGVGIDEEQQEAFIKELYDLMKAARMTADQINTALWSIGYEVEVTYQSVRKPKVTTVNPHRPDWTDLLLFEGTPPVTYEEVQIPEIHFKGRKRSSVNPSLIDKAHNTNGGNSSGSSSKPTYWKNPYDELYNLQEKINEAMRTREALERRYQKLLKSASSSLTEIRQGYRDQINLMRQQIALQQQLQQGRLRQIRNLANQYYTDEEGRRRTFASLGVTRYARYDEESGRIIIDWEGLEAIANDPSRSGEGEAVEAYISQLEQLVQEYEETRDAIWEIEDAIESLNDELIESYTSFEDRVMDAVVAQYEKEIDSLEKINDTIQDATSKVLDGIQEQIDAQRQERENAKTEEEIAKKEARLAYLRLDTSGANSLEIMQLEKELEEARQDYEDSLIDQALEQMRKDADLAAEQRAQQIEIMRAQLEYAQESGALWSEVYDLINGAFDENGEINMDSDLIKLLQAIEGFSGLSAFGQDEWIQKFVEELWRAWAGLEAGGAGSAGEHQGNGNSGGSGGSGEGSGEGSGGSGNTGGGNAPEGWPSDIPLPSTTSGVIQKGSTGKAVHGIQLALNELGYRDSNGNRLTTDAKFGPKTEAAVKWFQGTYGDPKITADGKVGNNTRQKFARYQYKTGGLADYTGLAWLDGTKTHPELVLNARDAENFILLKDILAKLVGPGIVTPGAPVGDAYYDIDINADIGSDYDVQRLADEIKRQIVQDTKYRNVNMINFIR